MYTSEYLLQKLNEKCIKLGKAATKNDIDNDPDIPNSSTYLDRFGGITKALEKINISANKIENLTLNKGIQYAKEFYKTYKKVPTSKDFDSTPGYPHSSFIRKGLGITWNKFLKKADLKTFTNGDNWIFNRKAELLIKEKLLNQGYKIKDLSEENINAPYSFIVNDSISIDVRYSSPILDNKKYYWKFKFYMSSKKCIPKYFICVGFYNDNYTIFVIPTEKLGIKQCISIRIKSMDDSKYFKYITNNKILLQK